MRFFRRQHRSNHAVPWVSDPCPSAPCVSDPCAGRSRLGEPWYAIICIITLLAGCGQDPVPAPTAYQNYNAGDATFACEYPDGWTPTGGGKHGPIWARFESGPAYILIRGDLVGSLLGDIAGGPVAGMTELAPELEAVHSVHEEIGKEAAKDKFSSYSEVAGPDELDILIGPARRTEFTAAGMFGDNLHGYRVTALGHDKRVVVYCICPESDWTTLQPAFDRVLGSLKRGIRE